VSVCVCRWTICFWKTSVNEVIEKIHIKNFPNGSKDGNSSFVYVYFILYYCLFWPLCVLDDAVRGSSLWGPLMVNVDQSGVSRLESVKMSYFESVIPLLTASFIFRQTSFRSKQTFFFWKNVVWKHAHLFQCYQWSLNLSPCLLTCKIVTW